MKYVFNMIAKPKKIKTSQMSSLDSVDQGMDKYLKNAFVCLQSIKANNNDVICSLACSFKISQKWEALFSNNNIQIIYLKFGNFVVDDKFDWNIVQYRYDVMQYIVDNLNDDDQVIMLDTDIICVGSLDNIYAELDNRILLYDVQHSLQSRDRSNIIYNYKKIYPLNKDCNLIHYGGEFIAGKIKFFKILFDKSVEVMKNANKVSNELINFNDEHITSIAIDLLQQTIKINNANAYIYRYWTNNNFYLVSTNYINNPVVLWHLPDEKNDGMLYLFDYVTKKKKIPSIAFLRSVFGFPKNKRSCVLLYLFIKIRKKLFIQNGRYNRND